MPKLKTHKSTAKRIKLKKSAKGIKVIKRADGQNHFNSKQSGKKRRNKRSDTVTSGTMHKRVMRAIPYA